MRVLISGYSPRTHTSYGIIIRELWTRLLKTGEFDIAQHAWFNLTSMGDVPWKLYPTKTGYRPNGKVGFLDEDKYGEETFEAVVREFRPDIVWCLSDIYMSKYIDRYKKKYGFKVVRWTLSEGEPVDRTNIDYVQSADKCVAITNYAAKLWEGITGDPYEVIYHGVDKGVFTPIDLARRNELREKVTNGHIGPDDYLITYVGRNQARKRPWIPFEILHYLRTGAWGWDSNGEVRRLEWDPVNRRHKDDKKIQKYAEPIPAKLWMHSIDDGTRWRFDLLEKEWNLGTSVFKVPNYSDMSGLSTEDMARVYQIADVLHMMSGSEGFGVPIIEAAACGVPSVYTTYSGHGEIGKVCKGYSTPYIGWEPAPISHVRWVYPDINAGIARYYEHYNELDLWHNGLGDKLANRAHTVFDYDKIAMQWLEILREVNETKEILTVGGKL